MKLSVAIQAGGESRRMGQDKALAPFMGTALIQRTLHRLTGLGDETIITTNHPETLAFLELPCFPDPVPGRGALGGIHTALLYARHPFVAIAACDLPFASPELFRLALDVIGDADVAIPRSADGLEPLHAIYRRETCLRSARVALDSGLWRVDSWFPRVRVRVLEPAEYAHLDSRTFLNVNTPEDLAYAEDQARRG